MTDAHSHAPDPDAERLSIGRLVFRVILAAIIVGLLVAYSMCFQVSEGYKAVVTRFGKPVRPVHQAGLYWKWPWPIEQARQIDVRWCLHNTPYTATFTRDRRNVILLTYVAWHVDDPLLYLQSVGNRTEAEEKLNGAVVDAKNQYMGRYELSALVSTEPARIKTAEIEQSMLADVAQQARQKYGIHVEQVGIKRVAYPEPNMESVLRQMKEERNTVAMKLRAEGEQAANKITADAKVEAAQILRAGQEEAGKIRGQAESQAAEIYDAAIRMDPEFFTFWRQLQTIKRTLGQKATLVMGTNRGIFRVLTEAPDAPQAKTPATAQAPDGETAGGTPPETEASSAAVSVSEDGS